MKNQAVSGNGEEGSGGLRRGHGCDQRMILVQIGRQSSIRGMLEGRRLALRTAEAPTGPHSVGGHREIQLGAMPVVVGCRRKDAHASFQAGASSRLGVLWPDPGRG